MNYDIYIATIIIIYSFHITSQQKNSTNSRFRFVEYIKNESFLYFYFF